MAEVAFARTFLASLDSRAVKLSPDHVEDPRHYPARPPYILPRMATAMRGRGRAASPPPAGGVTLVLRSLRNPPLDMTLEAQPLDTPLLDVKAAVAARTRVPLRRIRLLHARRPLADSKILRDVVESADGAAPLELSVVVVGAAPAGEPEDAADGASPEVAGGAAPLSDAFWADLRGFLMQRLKDEQKAEELSRLFRSSWESHEAAAAP